ncbi:hypothetical protein EVJ58_g10431 [Rhodofomes roseus]|uniref:Sodium/calcium exchanger membrane region domain-containing protein n=1 Tax=Rhodofomes roseus TaxID=34475 RepID=A0A4Y9XPK1_9APHY|nr:hypothetical protein EVJ58_g10431 [Rhodofomes roseus]
MASTESHNLHSAEAQTLVASTTLPASPLVQRRATFNDVTDSRRQSTRSQDNSKRASTLPNLTRISSRMSIMKKRLSAQLEPARPIGSPPGVWQGIKAIIMMSFCIPVSWALNFALPHTDSNDTLIFIFSFLAIIPLAKLLAFATDELSIRGNAVELIVAIIALIHCELQVVQSSLVGSILSNLLLVLGMCFFAGGVKFSEQGFGQSACYMFSTSPFQTSDGGTTVSHRLLYTLHRRALFAPSRPELRGNARSTTLQARYSSTHRS